MQGKNIVTQDYNTGAEVRQEINPLRNTVLLKYYNGRDAQVQPR